MSLRITRTQAHILLDGVGHLFTALHLIERIRARKPGIAPLAGPGPVGDLNLQMDLTLLCTEIGLASLCLFESGGPRDAPAMRSAKQARADLIAKLLDAPTIDALRGRGMRNAMMHVDERMLKFASGHDEVAWTNDCSFYYRPVTARPEVVMSFNRAYIFSEDRLLHLGEELDFATYYNAGQLAMKVLKPIETPDFEKLLAAQ